MLSSHAEVVVAGHICLDVIPALPAAAPEELLTPGKLTIVGPASVSTGGAVANTGLALHKLGVPVRLVGKVGADPLGAAVLDVLRRVQPSLAEGMIVAQGESSSYTVVMNTAGRDRSFLHHPGANDTFVAADVNDAHLSGARWFHFGYPPLMRAIRAEDGAPLAALFQKAKQHGLNTSLDMAFVDPASDAAQTDWPALLARTLPHVDAFLPSLDEIVYMLDRSSPPEALTREYIEDIASRLRGLGASMVGLKLGRHGLYVADSTGAGYYSPCFRVNEAGATGSGDCTIAGFIAGMLSGLPLPQVLLGAVGTGACCVEQPDATGGIVSWSDLQARIDAGWQRQEGLAGWPA